MNKKVPQQLDDWELYCQIMSKESEWRRSQYLSDKELLSIFPETIAIIPEKKAEWEAKRNELITHIALELNSIKNNHRDPFTQQFLREVVKVTYGKDLLVIDKQLVQLRLLERLANGKKSKQKLMQETVQKAKAIPISAIVGQYTQLKKRGKLMSGQCPFHEDSTPSFVVYPDTNTCWCFGCQQGGDTIALIMLLHSYTFYEAVIHLAGEPSNEK